MSDTVLTTVRYRRQAVPVAYEAIEAEVSYSVPADVRDLKGQSEHLLSTARNVALGEFGLKLEEAAIAESGAEAVATMPTKRKRRTKKEIEAEKAAAAQDAAEASSGADDRAEGEAPADMSAANAEPISYDKVQEVLIKAIREAGIQGPIITSKVKELFGVAKTTDVPPEKYGHLIAELEDLIEKNQAIDV